MKKYVMISALALSLVASLAVACPIPVHMEPLVVTFEQIIAKHKGRVGVCVQSGADLACVNGHETFSLQSTVKFLTVLAVMDQVDQQKLKITDSLTTEQNHTATIDALIRRALIDSDNDANDMLMDKIGGPKAVQKFLNRKEIEHINVSRDERHLQTETIGLTWRPDFTDKAVLDKAIKNVSIQKRDAAYKAYQKDTRDTATPRAMGILLDRFAKRDLLSSASTGYVIKIMRETKTGPDRLKAGLTKGWEIAHKTGTSSTWKNITAATNDIGIITTPQGKDIAIAVFVGDSAEDDAARAKLIADLSRATVDFYNAEKH